MQCVIIIIISPDRLRNSKGFVILNQLSYTRGVRIIIQIFRGGETEARERQSDLGMRENPGVRFPSALLEPPRLPLHSKAVSERVIPGYVPAQDEIFFGWLEGVRRASKIKSSKKKNKSRRGGGLSNPLTSAWLLRENNAQLRAHPEPQGQPRPWLESIIRK